MDFTGKGFRHSCAGCGTASAWANKETDASRIWNALPRPNDCAELVEALEELYKAAKRTSGIGATPGHHFVLLLAAVLKAKSALAKHKEPAQ